jgi:CO/xanthine dehydrogenase Mo-binding subunit
LEHIRPVADDSRPWPYGVRGVGEVPIVPPLATVANAIYHATGVRMRNMPASPRAILEELLPPDA